MRPSNDWAMLFSQRDSEKAIRMPQQHRPKRKSPPTPALYDAQYRALANFRYALRAFLAFSEAASSRSGVTPQQYQALLVIKASPKGPVTVRHLADQMFLKHNNAVQLVDRLVDARLVRREPSKDDRRAVSLTLTRKGEEKIAHLAAIHFRELAARQEELTDISHLANKMQRMR